MTIEISCLGAMPTRWSLKAKILLGRWKKPRHNTIQLPVEWPPLFLKHLFYVVILHFKLIVFVQPTLIYLAGLYWVSVQPHDIAQGQGRKRKYHAYICRTLTLSK